jgi:uncharacterized membrane protein
MGLTLLLISVGTIGFLVGWVLRSAIVAAVSMTEEVDEEKQL